MRDILDDIGLRPREHKPHRVCKLARSIVLFATIGLVISYFIWRANGQPAPSNILFAGLILICLQTVICYLTQEFKTLRSTLFTAIIVLMTIYLMLKL